MAVMQVSRETFDEQVRNAAKPVLLDFWASWCGPCRMVSPLVDEISEERDDILVGKVNVDEEPELAQMFNIMSIWCSKTEKFPPPLSARCRKRTFWRCSTSEGSP